ncbi:MAG TPA: cytochrome c-type biogenesis protein [Casimicrobiaceae bacterium]|jgi:cytochrome c-type biogenesis protein CcmH
MRGLIGIAIAGFTAAALAQAPAPAQTDLDARLKHLETELRCLVCQNQTLADSNAPLAEDLRREVRELANAGKSDPEIKAYLVARYGDFVLYRPPLQSNTWLLWIGPFALLAGGAAIWYAVVRRRRRGSDDEPSPSETSPDEAVARARQMIYEEP